MNDRNVMPVYVKFSVSHNDKISTNLKVLTSLENLYLMNCYVFHLVERFSGTLQILPAR